jgi:hypothetical protein
VIPLFSQLLHRVHEAKPPLQCQGKPGPRRHILLNAPRLKAQKVLRSIKAAETTPKANRRRNPIGKSARRNAVATLIPTLTVALFMTEEDCSAVGEANGYRVVTVR